jgi:hypothetical protein
MRGSNDSDEEDEDEEEEEEEEKQDEEEDELLSVSLAASRGRPSSSRAAACALRDGPQLSVDNIVVFFFFFFFFLTEVLYEGIQERGGLYSSCNAYGFASPVLDTTRLQYNLPPPPREITLHQRSHFIHRHHACDTQQTEDTSAAALRRGYLIHD